MQSISRRTALLRGTALAATAATGLPARAQTDNYPSKPVRIVTGFPVGQATDVLGRAVAARLQEAFGQQFFVENKPGAAGIIGQQAAMSAPADGYTLLLTSSGPFAVNPALYAKLPYDPVKDFVPVSGVAIVPLLLLTNPAFEAKTFPQFVAYAKANPGKVNFASGGTGVTNHLVMEMFRATAGLDMVHVPYKGGPPALTDLVAGQVQVMFETAVASLPLVRQGKLRAIATSSAKRIDAAPDLPTVAEQGYPGFSGVPWVAFAAPAGTPAAIVQKLNTEINKALSSRELREQFAAQGAEPMVVTPEELSAFLKSEIAKWGKAARDAGVKPE